ncbi:MAG: hypothetical protein ABI790_15310 [Betaproteobacteria bacterium]
MTMTYEAFLDEVTTLITEKYAMDDEDAIRLVMRAQAAGYFMEHDDDAALRTLDRAHQDARTLYRDRERYADTPPPALNS